MTVKKQNNKGGSKQKYILQKNLLMTVRREKPQPKHIFDSWFLCNDLIKHIESYEKKWISRLKSIGCFHRRTEDEYKQV